MYQINNRNNTVVRSILFILVIALFFTQTAFANRFDVETACLNAVPIDLVATHRGYDATSETAHLVRLDVPSTGILALDVTASDPKASEPRMGFFRDRCGEGRSGDDDVTTIEQSAAYLVLAVRTPGTYYFRLGAQNTRHTLGNYKLTSQFVAATVSEDEFLLEPEFSDLFGAEEIVVTRTHFHSTSLFAKGGEEESDPDGIKAPGSGQALLSVASLRDVSAPKGGEEESDPDGITTSGTKGGEEESDPDGFRVGVIGSPHGTALARLVLWYDAAPSVDGPEQSPRTDLVQEILWPETQGRPAHVRSTAASELRYGLDSLCQGERDDHSDTFNCSTPIAPGQTVDGEVGNGWGDDDDTFAFTLAELRTVRVEAAADVDVDVTIYDRFGQRLDSQIGGLVQTLAPGRYFLRIGGAAEGAYQLHVETLDW